jgi:hypothetical protein
MNKKVSQNMLLFLHIVIFQITHICSFIQQFNLQTIAC